MTTDLDGRRAALGASTVLWAGRDGIEPSDEGWTAFSGARSVDYNVALWTGDGDGLDATVERVLAAGVPAVVMVAGRALGEVQRLAARSWACIGSTPVMELALEADAAAGPLALPDGVSARRLDDASDRDAARALVADVFEVGDDLAAVALPSPGAGDDHALWGAFDGDGSLCSCLALVRVGSSAVVWSMATAAAGQRRGFGRVALTAALRAAAASGATRSLLYASPAGEPFYARLGYEEVERWQMWSRPRWVLGRA